MEYYKINYNALKQFISDNKNEYNKTDLMYLLNHGIINQLQLEDLMTVISIPMYKCDNFYQGDKGYYRQQGPLTDIQQTNDICTANRRGKKRMANHIVQDIEELLDYNKDFEELIGKEFLKYYKEELKNSDYEEEDIKIQEAINAVFDKHELTTLRRLFRKEMNYEDADAKYEQAMDDDRVRDLIFDIVIDMLDNENGLTKVSELEFSKEKAKEILLTTLKNNPDKLNKFIKEFAENYNLSLEVSQEFSSNYYMADDDIYFALEETDIAKDVFDSYEFGSLYEYLEELYPGKERQKLDALTIALQDDQDVVENILDVAANKKLLNKLPGCITKNDYTHLK